MAIYTTMQQQRNNEKVKQNKVMNNLKRQDLCLAFARCDTAQFEKLLADRTHDFSFIDKDGNGLLHALIMLMQASANDIAKESTHKKQLSMFGKALKKCDVNMKQKDGMTSMVVASLMPSQKFNSSMIELLLDSGADPYLESDQAQSNLITACMQKQNYICVNLLLDRKIHLLEQTQFYILKHSSSSLIEPDAFEMIVKKMGMTAKIHYYLLSEWMTNLLKHKNESSYHTNPDCMRLRKFIRILEKPAQEHKFYQSSELFLDFNGLPMSHHTKTIADAYSELIYLCVDTEEIHLLEHMLSNGVIYRKSNNTLSAYRFSQSLPNKPGEKILFEHEFNYISAEERFTPMHRAALVNDVEAGMKFTQRNKITKLALERLPADDVRRKNYKVYTFNEKDYMHYTPLHLAVLTNHFQFVEFLTNKQLMNGDIDLNAEVFSLIKQPINALDMAIERHYFDIAELLIERGMSIGDCKILPTFLARALAQEDKTTINFFAHHNVLFSTSMNGYLALQKVIFDNKPALFEYLLITLYTCPHYSDRRAEILNFQSLINPALFMKNFEMLDLLMKWAGLYPEDVQFTHENLLQIMLLSLREQNTAFINYFIQYPYYCSFELDEHGNCLLHHIMIRNLMDAFKFAMAQPHFRDFLEKPNNVGVTLIQLIEKDPAFLTVYQQFCNQPTQKVENQLVAVAAIVKENKDEIDDDEYNDDNKVATLEHLKQETENKLEENDQNKDDQKIEESQQKSKMKKTRKKRLMIADQKKETDALPSIAEASTTLFSPAVPAQFKNPIKKEQRDVWNNILRLLRGQMGCVEQFVRIDFDKWGIVNNEIHEKFPEIYDIFTTVLHRHPIPLQLMKHGFYGVGSSALNLLYAGYIKIDNNDIDLVFVGISLRDVQDTLRARVDSGSLKVNDRFVVINQFKQEQSRGLINLEFIQEEHEEKLKSMDILCYETNEFEKSIMDRDFTILAIMVDLMRKQIVAPLDWLQDLVKRKIRAVGDPDENFSKHFVRKIRGLRLYAKLRDQGFVIEDATAKAIKDEAIGFQANKISDYVELMNQLAKLIATAGFSSAHTL